MKFVHVEKANGDFALGERESAAPGPGWVKIDVEACGICHSDAFVKFGAFPGIEFPRIPGHEVAGVVADVGEGVSQWKAGDRVGVGWHGGHCFTCDKCRRGLFINCVNAKITGISHDGGWATELLAPAESLARIPESLSAVDAGPLLCAGVTVYNALRNSGARPGDTVAVQGIGGLGHLGVQYARKMGFHTVAISRGTDKASLAEELGAHDYIDAKADDPAQALQKLGGADVVLATAPNAAAIESVVEGLSSRGQVLVVAAATEPVKVSALTLLSGKRIQGWPSGSSIDAEDAMKFSALTDTRPRVETFALANAAEAFARVMENKVRFRAVLTMK